MMKPLSQDNVVMTRYAFSGRFVSLFHVWVLIFVINDPITLFSLYQSSIQSSTLALLVCKRLKRVNANSKFYDNSMFCKSILSGFLVMLAFVWLLILILQCGDVHQNPGPSSSAGLSTSSHSSVSDIESFLNLSHHLSFVHYNVQSILNKVDLLSTELRGFDIIAISETWLGCHVTQSQLLFPTFHPPERKDRPTDNHGGVMIYVKDTIGYFRRHDLEPNGIECIWVELRLQRNKPVLFGVFYRPPSSDAKYFSQIEDSISLAYDTGIKDIIITGDFNLNTCVPNNSKKILDLCQQYSLTQLIKDPTHFTGHSSSIIDLIFTSTPDSVVECGVGEPFLQQDLRYHCPIYSIIKFGKPTSRSYRRTIWRYDMADFDAYREYLSSVDWNQTRHADLDTYVDNFISLIRNASMRFIPHKSVVINNNDCSWMTNAIKQRIRQCRRAYRKAKQSGSENHWAKFRRLRNSVVSLIRKAKSDHVEVLANRIKAGSLSSGDWWKCLRSFITDDRRETIPPLFDASTSNLTQSDQQKADVLNAFFISQSHLDDSNHDLSSLPSLVDSPNSITSIAVSPSKVEDAISCLKVGKASGPDGIDNRIWIQLSDQLCLPLSDLFNCSLSLRKLPQSWKIANVCAIFKKGERSVPSNYRPISLLNTIEKVFERIIFKHVFNFLEILISSLLLNQVSFQVIPP